MMDSVADRLLDRFAASFTEKAIAHAATAPAAQTASAPTGDLNVIALMLGTLWDRIKRLFGG